MSGESETYGVNDLYVSIQGEGALTGTPMVVLRLQGCDVGCPWCDTKETWPDPMKDNRWTILDRRHRWLGQNEKFALATSTSIVRFLGEELALHGYHTRWVLITGGEPALRPLAPLVAALKAAGYMVAVETSGTARGVIGAEIDHICVSPKVGMPGGRVVLPEIVALAHEVKWVVGKQQDVDKLVEFLDTYPVRPDTRVSLQPLSQSAKATALCLKVAKERDWCLSIQVHKYIDAP